MPKIKVELGCYEGFTMRHFARVLQSLRQLFEEVNGVHTVIVEFEGRKVVVGE